MKGLLFTVQKALPLMPDGASIIPNASIEASKGWPTWSVYSATKAAVRSCVRTWTADLKDRRIRVNAVSPGVIDTPAWHVSEASEHRLKMAPQGVPLARTGTSDEIAEAVVFLASEDSSYITGSEPSPRPSYLTMILRRGGEAADFIAIFLIAIFEEKTHDVRSEEVEDRGARR